MYNESEIKKLAKKYRYEVHLAQNIVFVKTQYSKWQIVHENDEIIKIRHSNYRNLPSRLNHKQFNNSYHVQDLPRMKDNYNYEEIFKYISNHDKKAIKTSRKTGCVVDEILKAYQMNQKRFCIR